MGAVAVAATLSLFFQLLGVRSLWILDRETVNRKKGKNYRRNERVNEPERCGRKRAEKKRPNLHGMFISPIPSCNVKRLNF